MATSSTLPITNSVDGPHGNELTTDANATVSVQSGTATATYDDIAEVEYFHVIFDQHEIILSNGAKTESMYAGKQALLAVGEAARAEIFTIFPELRSYPDSVAPAAMLVPGRQARQLAKRHKKNTQPLVIA